MRFAIIGTGNIARTYVAAVEKLPGLEVVGFVSRSGRRPEYAPGGHEVARSLGEIRGNFDAVILATPPGLHHVDAIAAAELGKHVLTEKPLDVTRENMDAMITACRDAGVKLGVTYQRRMSPDNQAVKKLLDDGAMGRIYAADLSVKFYRDQAYYDSAPYRGTYDIDGGGRSSSRPRTTSISIAGFSAFRAGSSACWTRSDTTSRWRITARRCSATTTA